MPPPHVLLAAGSAGATGSRAVSGAPAFTRKGGEFSTAFGPQHVSTAAGSRCTFSPHWQKGLGPTELAFALYRLNLTGFAGESCITLHWYELGNLQDCFLALADFQADRWRYFPGADGVVTVPLQDLQAATAPATGDVFVAVILAGNHPWTLSSIEAGLAVNQITAVSPTGGWPGQYINFEAADNGLLGTGYWKWDLGAAVLNAPSQGGRETYVQLSESGDYPCRVSFSTGNGDTEYSFILHIGPMPAPHITGVAQYFSPPPPGPASTESVKHTSVVGGGHQGDGLSIEIVNDGGMPDAYQWDFGAAAAPATSTDAVVRVTWSTPGVYQATVTASNASGSDTFAFPLTILPVRPPDLRYVQPYSGTGLGSVFEDAKAELTASNNGGPIASWHWTFPAGITPAEAFEQSPVILAGDPGDYKCEVTAVNPSGSSTLAFNLAAQVLVPPTLDDVVHVPNVVQAGQDCWLTAYYGYDSPITDWSWDLGGAGAQLTPSDYAVRFVPAAPGTYSCSVTASNAAGSVTFPFTLDVH